MVGESAVPNDGADVDSGRGDVAAAAAATNSGKGRGCGRSTGDDDDRIGLQSRLLGERDTGVEPAETGPAAETATRRLHGR